MKNEGFSKRQIAKKQQIDFRTVSKYLSMTAEEFEEQVLKKERRRSLDLYAGVVTDWLRQHPDMTAAQVHDWLKEHYQVTIAERTIRRYVAGIRELHAIPKVKGEIRQYEAVADPPMGRQMQIDMGQAWVMDAYKRRHIKLYCVAAVLSHSRYKWGMWYTKPLTAAQFVQAMQCCFEYMCGMPNELVFDQDRLLAVDENYGDIIYTKEFEQFKQASGFEVYLCRGNDPESKGRIEAVIKYLKGNFAKNRQFVGIDIWNDDCADWLVRTGNAKEHETTKKIPAEVFEQERLFLKPVPSTNKIHSEILTRTVHKNNTIFFEGNRYTVPLGTYSPGLEVSLNVTGDKLTISNIFGDCVIAQHTLSGNKGELIANNNHRRDNSEKLDLLQDALCKRMGGGEDVEIFLTQIRKLKPRHGRDQFALIDKTVDICKADTISKALNYCLTHSLFSAVEFRNAADYFESKMEIEPEISMPTENIIAFSSAAAISKKRNLTEYALAAKGGEQ